MKNILESMIESNPNIVQTYDNEKYITVIINSKLCLMHSKIAQENIIASIDCRDNVIIYDRDKANIFIDHINVHHGKSDNIDNLPEIKIISYLLDFLAEDLSSLITFQESPEQITDIIKPFSESDRIKILKGLDTLNLLKGTLYFRAYTLNQINWLSERGFYYAVLNTADKRFEMTDTKFTKVIKNGSVGNWKTLIQNPNAYIIFFNKTDSQIVYNENLEAQLKIDIIGTPYTAANRLIKLEEQFTKAINEIIDIITAKKGIIDMSLASYPHIDHCAELIAKKIRAYQKEKDEIKKGENFEVLKSLYFEAYQELQKSQESLRKLYEMAE